jgi:hypothetical protein
LFLKLFSHPLIDGCFHGASDSFFGDEIFLVGRIDAVFEFGPEVLGLFFLL